MTRRNKPRPQTQAKQPPVELQTPAPSNPGGKWAEIGTGGLNSFGGYISEVYTSELQYPGCVPLFDRMYQADPEVTIVRYQTAAWGGNLGIKFEHPDEVEKPTDDDKRALDFSYSVASEVEGGGLERGLTDAMQRTPFYGWFVANTPPGLRNPDFTPPNNDQWRSRSNDGLIGYRRLAFRRYSSFYRWEMDEYTGKATGMWQMDSPNPQVLIPFDSSLHLTFGDNDNPEGLGTAIALYRLEGIKRAYETIMGIGFEHAAGHLKVKSTEILSETDKLHIRTMARMISSAQPGNYMALPSNLDGDLVDVAFAAGTSLLEVVRYYSILKLALMGMGWLANASGISGVGSFANVKDSSQMAVMLFNAMAQDFVRQMDEQLWTRLFNFPVNKAAFPNMTARPRMKLIPLDKDIPLLELGQFAQAFNAIMPLGDDDFLALRQKSGFLPNILPEKEEMPEPEPTIPDTDNETDADESLEGDGTPDIDAEMGYPIYFRSKANGTHNPFESVILDIETGKTELATPSKMLKTIEEKIKDMPEHLQKDINGLADEFDTLRKVSRREGVDRLNGISDEAWDKAVRESLQEGE